VTADEEGKAGEVRQICGLRVYWQFATDAEDYQMIKRLVTKI